MGEGERLGTVKYTEDTLPEFNRVLWEPRA